MAGSRDAPSMPLGPWRHVSGRFSPAQRSLIAGAILVGGALLVYRLVTPTLASYRSAHPGDCFLGSPSVSAGVTPGVVRTVSGAPSDQVVPCSSPHSHEVMGQADLPGDRSAPYDPDAVPAEAVWVCTEMFAPYVGRPLEGSSLGVVAYHPTRTEWTDSGERTVVCVVADPAATTFSSLRGSGR